MTHVLERQQIVHASLDTVFEFFKDPYNLQEITPPWMHFQILEATDREVREGTRISYTLRWQIFPMRWESRITEYRENDMFADEMLRGPYKRWYHTHRFREIKDGVEMRDRVEYVLPFGPLGQIAHAVMVRRQLRGIFDYRAEKIEEIFTKGRQPVER